MSSQFRIINTAGYLRLGWLSTLRKKAELRTRYKIRGLSLRDRSPTRLISPWPLSRRMPMVGRVANNQGARRARSYDYFEILAIAGQG